MKHVANPTSPHVLSLKISWHLHSLMKLFMMKKSLIQFMLILPSLIRMLPSSIMKKILKRHLFSVSLEVDSYSCDVDNEKKVTNGDAISIDDDLLTHSFFFMSSIIDSEIYVPYPSHYAYLSH